MNERLLRKFMSTVKCSICGHSYDAENINVLGHEEDLWFMSVFCSHCQSRMLVAAVVREEKLKVVEHSSAEEAFQDAGLPVSIDDVLDMHSFLRGFDGDFCRLFSDK